MNSELKNYAKNAPNKPGVYFWLGKNREILYVGRATNLRNRLNQYFLANVEPKTREMVSQAQMIKYQVTDNLLEAIILEAKNIKKHWPKYNIKDRDNRSFVYLVIPKKPFSKPLLVRGQDLKKFPTPQAKIFGPYQSFHLLQNALRLIRRVFPYSTCTPGNGRPCFDYQIGLCPGACTRAISATDYQKNIKNISLLLAGEKSRLIKNLIKENPEQLRALRQLQDVSLIAQESDLGEKKISRIEGYDISHLSGQESYGAMVVFSNGEADRSQYRLFKIKRAPAGDDERSLAEVLERRFQHSDWPKPDLIMIDGGTPQINFLAHTLAANNLKIPLIGISKFGGDKLVFVAKAAKPIRGLAENIKATLLKVREEAHRFANYGRKRYNKKIK